MKAGEIVSGNVVRSGSWGVYFQTPDGVLGFVDALELSWSHSIRIEDIPDVGSDIDAIVSRVFAEPQVQGHSFVASVRRLEPSKDPWLEQNRPIPGQRLSGTVILVGDGFSVVELPSGATAAIHPCPVGLVIGQSVMVTVTAVDPERQIIASELTTPS